MKKKIMIAGVTLFLALSITACGKETPEEVPLETDQVTEDPMQVEVGLEAKTTEAENKITETPKTEPTKAEPTKEPEVTEPAPTATAPVKEAAKEEKTSQDNKPEPTPAPATDDTQKADTPEDPATQAPPEAPAKTGVPTKDEILGKIFTQAISATFVAKENGETFSDAADLPDVVMSADVMAGYNEANGSVALSETSQDMVMNMVLTFSYDANGRIVYSGPVNMDAADFTATGTVSGYLK